MDARRLLALGIVCFVVLLGSCSKSKKPDSSDEGLWADALPAVDKGLDCSAPNRAEIGKPFITIISLPAPPVAKERPPNVHIPATTGSTSEAATAQTESNSGKSVVGTMAPTNVEMASDGTANYSPKKFSLSPGHQQSVSVTLLPGAGSSGLASVKAFPNDDHEICERVVDIGFQGHLQVLNPTSLSYDDERALEVQLLDSNSKPMSLGINVLMDIQSADAALGVPAKQYPMGDQGNPIMIPMSPGSSSSGPFRLAATNWKGGPVHLTASLKLGSNDDLGGAVLTQSTFTFESDPVWWLPITLAIGGALLYALYKITQSTIAPEDLFWLIVKAVGTSIVAGIIAWLFADFDLLGLKLDPKVLRTYPLLGFIFSFVGIDVVLKGKLTK